MKSITLLTALLLTLSFSAFSQRPTTWKGGTPGMKNDWFCPQNWSTSAVPDEFSDVIIPDVSTTSFAAPVIKSGHVEVNSVFFLYNGALTIARDATITVLGFMEGSKEKNFHGEGVLMLPDMPGGNLKKLVAVR